jgi:RNA polymerase sigma-70 factor (ECF subfamily)
VVTGRAPDEACASGRALPSAEFSQGMIAVLPDLRAFARGLTGDGVAADDLVQEALLRAWDRSDRFEAGTNLRAWLFVILRNQFYSQHRRRREVEDPDGALVAAMTDRASQEGTVALAELRTALETLPSEQREALLLVGAAGFSHEEAARISGCALGTMKSRVWRARAALMRRFAAAADETAAEAVEVEAADGAPPRRVAV